MIIENYTLKEFLQQSEAKIQEYIIVLNYIKPIETKRKLRNMKLKHIELIKQKINSSNDNNLIKIISKVQKIKKDEVYDIKIIELFGIINSIKEQLTTIIKAEENALTPNEIDFKFEMVGGSERMAKFGIFNTLESLTDGDATKYNYFLNLPYSEVFTILLMRKTRNDIRTEMSKIKTP